jgi:hypothetical protein
MLSLIATPSQLAAEGRSPTRLRQIGCLGVASAPRFSTFDPNDRKSLRIWGGSQGRPSAPRLLQVQDSARSRPYFDDILEAYEKNVEN